jgi:hypothetical protein
MSPSYSDVVIVIASSSFFVVIAERRRRVCVVFRLERVLFSVDRLVVWLFPWIVIV